MQEEIKKIYFSITEVASQLSVNASLIRFWESEFPSLKPKKDKKGNRQFTQKDIDHLKTIHFLLKEKGHTIQGAKELIKSKEHLSPEKSEIIESLESLKTFLINLRNKI